MGMLTRAVGHHYTNTTVAKRRVMRVPPSAATARNDYTAAVSTSLYHC